MTIIVHRGTHQIGGCATEIKTNTTRIIIDFGAELDADNARPLDISGVTSGTPMCDAVLFSHYHGDHIGLMETISSSVPLYMGEDAKQILAINAESTTLPILRKQLAEIEKGIDNIVNAIQAGIFSNSTKQRLDELEAEKSELSVQILKEEISKPTITKEEILYYLTKYRKLNMKQLDHRRRLIDSFVNAIYLFDDYLVITFNYKEGTKTITFAEIEEAFGSDLSSLTAPNKGIILLDGAFVSCVDAGT